MAMKMALTSAVLQLGTAAPFRCVDLPVRRGGLYPEVRLNGVWHNADYNAKGAGLPKLVSYRGMPVAGVATTWESEESHHNQLDLRVARAVESIKKEN